MAIKKQTTKKSTKPAAPSVPTRKATAHTATDHPPHGPAVPRPEAVRGAGSDRAILQRLGAERSVALAGLGLHTTRDILSYEPVRAARLLVAASHGKFGDIPLANYLSGEYIGAGQSKAPALPVQALLKGKGSLSPIEQQILNTIGVKTVADLAALGDEVDPMVAWNSPDNGFSEPPSAPAELIPGLAGAISNSTRFTSFVQDWELGGLAFYIDEHCMVPLPLSQGEMIETGETDENGKPTNEWVEGPPPTLGDIFTNTPCPMIRLGYMLDHRQQWINLGTHLGEVVHSVSLAPGESRNIAQVNWRRSQLDVRHEDTGISEKVSSIMVQNRALEEVATATAREHQSGQTRTEANTTASANALVGAAALAGGGYAGSPEVGGAVGGSVLGAGGMINSDTQALGMIEAASAGDRKVVGELHQRITQTTSQNSSAAREMWSTVVVEGAQAEAVNATTSNITNYNHMHALNIEYYEVLQRYLARIELRGVQPLMYLPFHFFDFTGFNYVRDYWEVVRPHIDDEWLCLQGDLFFVDEVNDPVAPILQTVPAEPAMPVVAPVDVRVKDLTIKVIAHPLVTNPFTINLKVVKAGSYVSWDSRSSSPILPGEDSDIGPGESGYTFTFEEITGAERITGIHMWPTSTFGAPDMDYRVVIDSGNFRAGSVEENLGGTPIVSDGSMNIDVTAPESVGATWAPASSIEIQREIHKNDLAPGIEYNAAITARNDIITHNENAQNVYDAFVADKEMFKNRLGKLLRRRRHFFTRVILDAIEPEQILNLLNTLIIRDKDNGQAWVPLHEIAHTIPIGMTSGAFVLRLKDLSERTLQSLKSRVPKQNWSQDFDQLLHYSTSVNKDFATEEQRSEYTETENVYLPTGGLFAESVLGRANGAEYLDMRRNFNWQDSPIPHQPPAILPADTGTRYQQPMLQVNEPSGTINLMNPVSFPDPTGLRDVLAAVQNPDMFRDMSKAGELTTVLGGLASLAGQMGEAASKMTGEAAAQAMRSATQIGSAVAGTAQSMLKQAMSGKSGALGNLTQQGAALNEVRKQFPPGAQQDDAVSRIIGTGTGPGSGTGARGGADTGAEEVPPTGGDDAGSPAIPGGFPQTSLPETPAPGVIPQPLSLPSEGRAEADRRVQELLQPGEDGLPTVPDSAALIDIGQEWYTSSVLPRLQQASSDDRYLAPALSEWLDWWGEMQILGVAPELSSEKDEARIWAIGGLRNAIGQAEARATATNDWRYLLDALAWSAQASLLGLADASNRLDTAEVLADFDLRMEIFDVQFPLILALDTATTLQAKAALKIANNEPIVTESLVWQIGVNGGTSSGPTTGYTNNTGGFALDITRTSENNFYVEVSVEFQIDGVTVKAQSLGPLTPTLT